MMNAKIIKNFGTLSAKQQSIQFYNINVTTEKIMSFAKLLGYQIKEFSDENKPDFRKYGYDKGYVWVYNPNDKDGAFEDIGYTRRWRYIHELAHAMTYQSILNKYGIIRVNRGQGVLTYNDAVISMDWEISTLNKQHEILEFINNGTKLSDAQKARECNTLSADLIHRCISGGSWTRAKYC